jgi:hypothetical protein
MNHCVDHQSEWNNYILYFIIIPVACGTHLVVLACMLKMNPSSWSLEFFVQMIMLTTCIYLTMYYHLQLHFIRLQRLIPTIYYVNMIILLRLDIPITSRRTLPLRQPWQSPPRPQYLLLMVTLTTYIYLTMYYHLQLHLIRLQRLIPTIYGYTLRQYDNSAQIRHSDNLSPYTTT